MVLGRNLSITEQSHLTYLDELRDLEKPQYFYLVKNNLRADIFKLNFYI